MRHSNGIRRAALATTAVMAVAAAVTGILPGTAMAASTTISTPPPACPASALQVSAWQAVHRPVGTGTGAAVVQFTNVSRRTCVLKGHPTVAGAGNGSPSHNTPLKVTRKGKAATVKVRPRGKAWVKLTFVQVQGEADGHRAAALREAPGRPERGHLGRVRQQGDRHAGLGGQAFLTPPR